MKQIRWVRVLAVVGIVAIAGAALAMRYFPRPHTPATISMRAAARVLATAASAGAAVASAPAPEPQASPKTQREHLLAAAYGMRGIPYLFGAKGPDKLDCSGFTKAAYAAADVDLPDGSFNQAKSEKPLASAADLTEGDLLFYRWAGADNITHVTMYAGDGWVIGTGSPGQAHEVSVYPLADDLRVNGAVITYRHVTLSDE